MNAMTNQQRRSKRGMGMNCPHCGGPASIRSSQKVTDTCSDYWIDCNDMECGHSWRAQLSYMWGTAPSLRPRTDITLPFSPAFKVANANLPPAMDPAAMPPSNDSG